MHPEAHTQIGIPAPNHRLPVEAHLGKVRLAVSNLERSLAFYRDVIGLALAPADRANPQRASLTAHGDARVLLELEEVPGVKPIRARSRLGLYHTAFLLPSREALASFVRHLAALGTHFGAADHLFSEALYLHDPDGLEVEVYADLRRELWVHERRPEGLEVVGAVRPLNFSALPKVAEDSWHGAPAGTKIGHLHFYAGDLPATRSFYHAALGFDISGWTLPGALFFSVGGYHHHVGLNTWAARSPKATEEDARIMFWELILPDREAMDAATASLTLAGYAGSGNVFTDPWGIRLALIVEDVS